MHTTKAVLRDAGELAPAGELRISNDLSLPRDAVSDTVGIIGNRGSGKTNTAGRYVEQALRAGVQCAIIDPTDGWYGLKSNKAGDGPGFPVVVLGGRKADLPLDADDGKAIADFVVASGASIVLSTRHFSKTQEKRFVTDFCNRLYYLKGQQDDPTPLLLVIDEASRTVPQRVMGEDAHCVGAVQQIVRQGRGSGFGVVLIDQRAATVNKDVLEMLETLIVHRATGPLNKKALLDWVRAQAEDETGAKEFLDSLPKLENGEAWVWSPNTLRIFKRVKMLMRDTFDSSFTPKIGQRRVSPTHLADVDLEALRATLATSIEKARADDPDVLRARIAELEASRDAGETSTVAELRAQLVGEYQRGLGDGSVASEHALTAAYKIGWEDGAGAAFTDVRALLEAVAQRALTVAETAKYLDEDVRGLQGHTSGPSPIGPPPASVMLARVYDAGVSRSVIVPRSESTLGSLPPADGRGWSPSAADMAAIEQAIAPRAGVKATHFATVTERSASSRGRSGTPHIVENTEPMKKTSNGVRNLAEQICDALVFFRQLGFASPTRAQIAAYIGYHPRTPSYVDSLKSLEQRRFVELGTGTVTALAPALRLGKIAPADVVSDNAALHRVWLSKLDGIARDVVQYMTSAPSRRETTRDALARVLEYHVRTPSFVYALKKLETLDLVTLKSGRVSASAALFPNWGHVR